MENLYDQFSIVASGGDEVQVRTFLTDHFQELPEQIQQKVAFLFLQEELETRDDVTKVQEAIVLILEAFKRQKDEADNQLRINELKTKLDAS